MEYTKQIINHIKINNTFYETTQGLWTVFIVFSMTTNLYFAFNHIENVLFSFGCLMSMILLVVLYIHISYSIKENFKDVIDK